MITEELLPLLQGACPAWVVTASADNVPNCTSVSQVYPVDAEHVAISNQFFSKTFRNLADNPEACIQLLSATDLSPWILEVVHVRTETEGDLFEQMEMQLAAIASMSGMADVFKLKSAYVFKVRSVRLEKAYQAREEER
jgi:predicted pyridoxine 5'-phosphate oxidase superfamily flavin-nucleotide-binding protein